MSKPSFARFGACTHEWRDADPPGPIRVLVATIRKGMDRLAALMEEQLKADPFSGVIFCFCAKRADKVKLIFWDGTGLCLFAKRLEGGKFRWSRIGTA